MPGTAFGLAPHGFHADRHGEYLADVRETLPLYRDRGRRPPRLDPARRQLRPVGQRPPRARGSTSSRSCSTTTSSTTARRSPPAALVTKEWEHKGHRFVELDVLHLANLRPVARTTHTAIYRRGHLTALDGQALARLRRTSAQAEVGVDLA